MEAKKDTKKFGSGTDEPEQDEKTGEVVKITTTPWVKKKLDELAGGPGPWPNLYTRVAEQILRERIGEMFREEWEPTVFPRRQPGSRRED